MGCGTKDQYNEVERVKNMALISCNKKRRYRKVLMELCSDREK